MVNLIRIIDLITSIRKISQRNLPITTSFIPYDILVYLYKAYTDKQHVNLKEFFLQFKHSEMGVRYHLKQLIDDGWISLSENPNDKRSKVLVMSPVFISNMEKTLYEIAAYIQQQALLASNGTSPGTTDNGLSALTPDSRSPTH